jgi:hypothetical protein
MTVALQSKFSGVVGGGSGLPLNFHCSRYGDAYSIDLRLWDGGLVDDAFGRPGYESVDHTAVQVGTCACPPGTVDEWDAECVVNNCRSSVSELSANGEKAWNPVQAPEIAVKKTFHPLETELKYPVVCGDSPDAVCDAEHNSAKWNHLVFGRRMPFSRDPQKNFHRLTWSWQDAMQFPEYDKDVDYSAKTTGRTTRARASWANFGQPYDASFYSSLVSYSDAVPVDSYQRDCSGIVYLGPPFILDYFQGMTDIWLDGRTTASQPPAGWLLGRDPVAERVLLYHLGPDTMQVQGVQELLAPTGVDLLSPASTGAVGVLPGTFWGLDGGVQLTLAMYQAGTTPGSDQSGEPPRLLLAALETGAEVNVEDLGVRYGVAIPALTDAHVVILDARQQVLLVGRTPAGQVVAHRLRLTEGTWDAPRPLEALAQRRGFGLVHDPAFDRLLAFGGETGGVTHAAEATAEIVSIPLSTLATEVLDLALPETAARSRAGVFLDPVSQRLHVLGGEREGVTLDDGFAVDLRDGAVEAMAAGGGPGALIEPFLYVDRRTGRLWAGDVLGQAGSDGLPLYLRTSDGA